MSKKNKKLPLSLKQLEYLISCTVRNHLDLIGGEDGGGYRFTILLDCLNPKGCIPHGKIPSDEQEEFDILESHGVLELAPFLSNIMGIRKDGKLLRAVETGIIDSSNIDEFLLTLDEMDRFWDEITGAEAPDLEGKNLIEGNGTVN